MTYQRMAMALSLPRLPNIANSDAEGQHLIDQEEEDRRQEHHDEHHDGGDPVSLRVGQVTFEVS